MSEEKFTAEIEAINQQRAQWIDALNSANADGFASACTEDVLWLPPDGSQFKGREEIRNWLAEPFASYEFNYSQSNLRIRVVDQGDRAIEEAHFVSQVRVIGTEEWLTHEGDCLLIWSKNESGQWAIELYVDRGAPYVNLDQ